MSRSVFSKTSFASASFTAALLTQYFQSKAQFFYVTEMKTSPEVYAAALAIWAIWNSINDPLAGWLMDRHRTRWGRRLPWMIAFWIPLSLSYGLIWAPPEMLVGNDWMLFVWLVVILMIYDTSYTVVILAWASLFPEIFTDHKDRNIVSGLRQVFSLIALVVALVIPPFFVTDGNIPSYATFGWILGIVTFLNLGMSFYGCKEPKKSEYETEYSLKEGILVLKNNRNFRAFLFGNLITYFAYGQFLAMMPFYRKFILKEDEQFETLAYGGAILVTFFSLIFWIYLTNKKEPRYTYNLSAALFALMILPVWFVEDTQFAILFLSIVGFALAGQLMVVDLLLAEVVDEDFVENGYRREGIFFGFNGFFIRLAILLQAISLATISPLTGFDKYKDEQTELAQIGIKIQFILLPIIGFVSGVYVIKKYYDIHGDKLLKLREKVQAKNNNTPHAPSD